MSADRELEGGFSRAAIGWIAGLGVASFVLALILTAFGEDLFGKPTPHANSYSRSALGHRGLVELLQSLGVPAGTNGGDSGFGVLPPNYPAG